MYAPRRCFSRAIGLTAAPRASNARSTGNDSSAQRAPSRAGTPGRCKISLIVRTSTSHSRTSVRAHCGRARRSAAPERYLGAGTVTPEIAKTIQEYKAGKVEFRNDSAGIVHAVVGQHLEQRRATDCCVSVASDDSKCARSVSAARDVHGSATAAERLPADGDEVRYLNAGLNGKRRCCCARCGNGAIPGLR